MADTNNRVYDVVLSRRLRGIYPMWIDCAAQIDGWRGVEYKAFTNFADAQKAYMASNKQRTLQSFQYTSATTMGTSSSSSGYKCAYDNIPTNVLVQYAPDTASQNALLRWSMQDWMRRATQVLRVEEPRYTCAGDITHDGQHYCRYYVAVNSRLIGRPPVPMGRYGRTGYLAYEDAALLMLRRLVAGNGQTILDFNYINSEDLQ